MKNVAERSPKISLIEKHVKSLVFQFSSSINYKDAGHHLEYELKTSINDTDAKNPKNYLSGFAQIYGQAMLNVGPLWTYFGFQCESLDEARKRVKEHHDNCFAKLRESFVRTEGNPHRENLGDILTEEFNGSWQMIPTKP